MELTRPFAENGDRQDFAIETQGNGEMSLQQGFGPLYSQAPESGGLFIDRAKFNQLMYLTTKGVLNSPKNHIGNLELIVGDGPNEIKTLDEALIKSKEINTIGQVTTIILKKDVVWSAEVTSINALIKSESESIKRTITFKKNENSVDLNSYVNFNLSFIYLHQVKIRVDESVRKTNFVFAGINGILVFSYVDVEVNQTQLNTAFCSGGSITAFHSNFVGLSYFCFVGGSEGHLLMYSNNTFNQSCSILLREGGIAVTGNIANLTGNIAKNTLTPQGIWFFDTTI